MKKKYLFDVAKEWLIIDGLIEESVDHWELYCSWSFKKGFLNCTADFIYSTSHLQVNVHEK